ncbi:MAG: PhoH family protein, partial [Nitrosomonadales bacterium]|nr:PhoH family protein [Nitrosomonadales bacterium]
MKKELTLSPQDNKKLANLCGPLDENISQISVGLDLKISRKNSSFIFDGDEKKVLLASQLIESIYLRATRAIAPEDIQLSLVELNQKETNNKQTSPQLHTLKTDLQGRTPMQVSYLRNIQENDINFGIGPAGTGKT